MYTLYYVGHFAKRILYFLKDTSCDFKNESMNIDKLDITEFIMSTILPP